MPEFINNSNFPALQYVGLDQHDVEFHITAARITYDIIIKDSTGHLRLEKSQEQEPLNYVDKYYTDSVFSSIEYESDLAPYKPKTDIIINATAFAPYGKATPSFDIAVSVAGKIKTLRINGPRVWTFGFSGWSLSKPESIDSLDILYEYASGGCHDIDGNILASPDNPSGMGWYPAEYLKHCKDATLPAPQIESIITPIENIRELVIPQGFGFFGKGWRGRIEYAGTYDNAWLEARHPYLPKDFNFCYWCGAHPTLQIPHPKPFDNIPVKFNGLLPANEIPNGKGCFFIPVETLFVFIKTESGLGITRDMVLDTIVIDMRVRKVFCTYRITLAEALQITEVQLRYIAPEEREMQKKRAEIMSKATSSSTFIPLPPTLLGKR